MAKLIRFGDFVFKESYRVIDRNDNHISITFFLETKSGVKVTNDHLKIERPFIHSLHLYWDSYKDITRDDLIQEVYDAILAEKNALLIENDDERAEAYLKTSNSPHVYLIEDITTYIKDQTLLSGVEISLLEV